VRYFTIVTDSFGKVIKFEEHSGGSTIIAAIFSILFGPVIFALFSGAIMSAAYTYRVPIIVMTIILTPILIFLVSRGSDFRLTFFCISYCFILFPLILMGGAYYLAEYTLVGDYLLEKAEGVVIPLLYFGGIPFVIFALSLFFTKFFLTLSNEISKSKRGKETSNDRNSKQGGNSEKYYRLTPAGEVEISASSEQRVELNKYNETKKSGGSRFPYIKRVGEFVQYDRNGVISKGTYISDEYAVRFNGSDFCIDFIPTGRTIEKYLKKDAALKKAKELAGIEKP
jgi:hypothetical protein